MMEFYERASGARMHAAYVRPGGVHQEICPRNWRFGRLSLSNFIFKRINVVLQNIIV